MKFFRLDLLTLLISLFILNSCKNQSPISLGVQTSSQANGSLVDTSTIITNTVLEDSVVTSGSLPKNALAFFNDPIFGTTTSDLATDLNLPNSGAYTLPTGTIYIDSVRLVMGYADGFYGDSLSSNYTVNVYQLKQRFNTDTNYYSNKKFSYNSSILLGTLPFTPRPHDSVKISNIIAGAPDTLIKSYPQIRIPFSTAFINQNFFNAGLALNSNVIFNNFIKGLYLTLDRTKTTGAGGIIMFKPTDTLAVYYRAVNGTTIDTAQAYLPITNLAASIKHTYSTPIQTELNNTTSSRGVVYLQGLAGLRAKISFPGLLANLRKNLAKKDSDIVLNRAELVVTVSAGSNIPYSVLPKISMYRLDLAHQRTEVEDASSTDPRSGGVSVFGGFAVTTTAGNGINGVPVIQYHFIITGYLQDLLSGTTVDYGTYIAPIDTSNTTSVDIAATPQVASRTVAVGGNTNSPYKMKLNIIYTKILK